MIHRFGRKKITFVWDSLCGDNSYSKFVKENFIFVNFSNANDSDLSMSIEFEIVDNGVKSYFGNRSKNIIYVDSITGYLIELPNYISAMYECNNEKSFLIEYNDKKMKATKHSICDLFSLYGQTQNQLLIELTPQQLLLSEISINIAIKQNIKSQIMSSSDTQLQCLKLVTILTHKLHKVVIIETDKHENAIKLNNTVVKIGGQNRRLIKRYDHAFEGIYICSVSLFFLFRTFVVLYF